MPELVDIYLGRQPIFDVNMRVYAYELLFRSGSEQNHAQILGADNATAQVMMNLFGDLGLKEVVGEHKAFINFTEGLLLRENRPFFPRKQVMIECHCFATIIALVEKLTRRWLQYCFG